MLQISYWLVIVGVAPKCSGLCICLTNQRSVSHSSEEMEVPWVFIRESILDKIYQIKYVWPPSVATREQRKVAFIVCVKLVYNKI